MITVGLTIYAIIMTIIVVKVCFFDDSDYDKVRNEFKKFDESTIDTVKLQKFIDDNKEEEDKEPEKVFKKNCGEGCDEENRTQYLVDGTHVLRRGESITHFGRKLYTKGSFYKILSKTKDHVLIENNLGEKDMLNAGHFLNGEFEEYKDYTPVEVDGLNIYPAANDLAKYLPDNKEWFRIIEKAERKLQEKLKSDDYCIMMIDKALQDELRLSGFWRRKETEKWVQSIGESFNNLGIALNQLNKTTPKSAKWTRRNNRLKKDKNCIALIDKHLEKELTATLQDFLENRYKL